MNVKMADLGSRNHICGSFAPLNWDRLLSIPSCVDSYNLKLGANLNINFKIL